MHQNHGIMRTASPIDHEEANVFSSRAGAFDIQMDFGASDRQLWLLNNQPVTETLRTGFSEHRWSRGFL